MTLEEQAERWAFYDTIGKALPDLHIEIKSQHDLPGCTALTWNPFCNPFVFTFMHGMGVPLFTRIKSKGTHEHDNFGRPGHPARSSIVETGMETNVSVDRPSR